MGFHRNKIVYSPDYVLIDQIYWAFLRPTTSTTAFIWLIDVDDGGRRNIVDKLLGYTWYAFHKFLFLVHPSTPTSTSVYSYANCFLSHTSLCLPDDALIVRSIYIEKRFIVKRIPGVSQEFIYRFYICLDVNYKDITVIK